MQRANTSPNPRPLLGLSRQKLGPFVLGSALSFWSLRIRSRTQLLLPSYAARKQQPLAGRRAGLMRIPTALEQLFRNNLNSKLNIGVESQLLQERSQLRPLPSVRLPQYSKYDATVRKWSTIHFAGRTYSVPSRLIGCVVEVRQYAELVEVIYRGKLAASMPRLRGDKTHRIDYHHVIWSLVKKPGAFARYRYREELFPSLTFRKAYDALHEARGDRADVEYVRILHLAASTYESTVDTALKTLLGQGHRFDYAAVKAIASPEQPSVPDIQIARPDPAVYDGLLACIGGQP